MGHVRPEVSAVPKIVISWEYDGNLSIGSIMEMIYIYIDITII